MATSNFHNVNASNVFVIELEDEYSFDENINYIQTELQTLNEDHLLNYRKDIGEDTEELRSYPSRVLGVVSKFKEYSTAKYGKFTVSANVTCVLRSGYYQHANLDWNIDFSIEGNETENNIDSINYQLEYLRGDYNKSDFKAKQILNWLEKSQTELSEKVEAIYNRCSQSYQVTARFSNGETIYKKV